MESLTLIRCLCYDCEHLRHQTVPFLTRSLLFRTCKSLASLCAPILFKSLRLEEVDLERLRRLADNSRTLGKFVRDLTITVQKDVVTDWELRMYQMLPHMPNVRSLTVVHEREDTQYHSLLLHFVSGYQYLEHVTLREANYNPIFSNFDHPNVEVAQTFFHYFLQTILNAHASRLRTLQLYTLLPLRAPVYIKIRDKAPKLQALTLTTNIDVALRELFADSTPWASGQTGSLERLTFHECGGAHVGNFARNVLRGVYGPNLKEVNIIACGDNSDMPYIPPASTPSYASIERMQVDHLGPWELSALSLIPTQDISFTRMPPESVIELTVLLTSGLPDSDGRRVGFPSCKRIRMNPNLAPGQSMEGFTEDVKCAYEGLKKICQRREIQCTWDAVVWGNCLCHSNV